jgi:hypothetical protein
MISDIIFNVENSTRLIGIYSVFQDFRKKQNQMRLLEYNMEVSSIE